MSFITVNNDLIAVTKRLHVNCFNKQLAQHQVLEVPGSKSQEDDYVCDIVISPDCSYIALITTISKRLLVYKLPNTEVYKSHTLPRSASKVRFANNCTQILVADKSGDVLIYDVYSDNHKKLLGHLSLLLDILETNNGQYIITSDRDEKIRVSCYPNTYNIQTFCLGHKEFVNHLELLPHNNNYLTSTSGDGTIKFWNYITGQLYYTIDTFLDVNDNDLKECFVKSMDNDGVEVNALPIVHYTIAKLNETCSIIALSIYRYNNLLIYTIDSNIDKGLSHKFQNNLLLDKFPTGIQLNSSNLYVYDDSTNVLVYNILYDQNKLKLELNETIKMFDNIIFDTEEKICKYQESIKILYKRKFDNVLEYQERKRQRLEQSTQ